MFAFEGKKCYKPSRIVARVSSGCSLLDVWCGRVAGESLLSQTTAVVSKFGSKYALYRYGPAYHAVNCGAFYCVLARSVREYCWRSGLPLKVVPPPLVNDEPNTV